MDSKHTLCYLAFFVLALSTVAALNCISCSEYLNLNTSETPAGVEPCRTRKNGTTACKEGEVCSTIYDPNTNLITRGCDHKDKCQNIPQNCTTCSTDLCGNSGFNINPLFAPVLAGLIFAALGR